VILCQINRRWNPCRIQAVFTSSRNCLWCSGTSLSTIRTIRYVPFPYGSLCDRTPQTLKGPFQRNKLNVVCSVAWNLTCSVKLLVFLNRFYIVCIVLKIVKENFLVLINNLLINNLHFGLLRNKKELKINPEIVLFFLCATKRDTMTYWEFYLLLLILTVSQIFTDMRHQIRRGHTLSRTFVHFRFFYCIKCTTINSSNRCIEIVNCSVSSHPVCYYARNARAEWRTACCWREEGRDC